MEVAAVVWWSVLQYFIIQRFELLWRPLLKGAAEIKTEAND